jgi:hypothetical protein
VRAAVDDVHHRDGQSFRVRAADVAVKRNFQKRSRRPRRRHRNRQQSVRAQIRFVLRAVQCQHRFVNQSLVERVQTFQLVSDFFVDVFDRV